MNWKDRLIQELAMVCLDPGVLVLGFLIILVGGWFIFF